jgi:Domain of unknown function (DUF4136)
MRSEQEKYTMKKTFALALFGLLLCNGLSLFAASISTDYDHSANFSQYKTYSWLKVQAGDSLWAERIQQDVDAQLAAKGWTKVDSNGNASITAFRSTQEQPTLETFYDGFGGGWGWRGRGGFGGDGLGMSTTTTEDTKVGTIVVDIFDSQTKQLLWRGKESSDLGNNADKNSKNLAKNLADLFKRFPPSH